MPKTSKLNEKQKDRVVELIEAGKTRTAVAAFFNVSPRTIYRVLHERGVQPDSEETVTSGAAPVTQMPALSEDDSTILRICKVADIDAEKLRRILATPALTAENIRSTLAHLAPDQLGMFIHSVYVERVQELLQTTQPLQQEIPA